MEINKVYVSELNKQDEITVSLTSNDVNLKGQEINMAVTNEL